MADDPNNEVGIEPQEEIPQLKPELAPKNRSRRKLAAKGLLGSGIVALSSLFGLKLISNMQQEQQNQSYEQSQRQSYEPQAYSLPSLETKDVFGGQLKLGEIQNLSLESVLGNNWIDDGHIPYFTTPQGSKRYFVVVGNSTLLLETDGKTLKDAAQKNDFKQVKDVLSPSMQEGSDGIFDTYTGITSILQLDKNDPMHIIGIGHFERRVQNAPIYAFTAHIGKAESFDGGLTWNQPETIITGDEPARPGERATGAGQPAAYFNEKDGYVYIMYIDWAAQKNVQHADQLYMARAKANSDGGLGNIEYLLDDNSFGDLTPGKLKPVISATSDFGYAALPSLSFNTNLNQYLAVFETNKGFYATTSADLINWDPKPKEILDLAKNGLGNSNGVSSSLGYITYPTFLSDGSYPSDQTTGNSGTLYFAFEPNTSTPNNLAGVDFNFKNASETGGKPTATPYETALTNSNSNETPTISTPTPSPETTQELSYDRDVPNTYNGNLDELKSDAINNPDKIVTKNSDGNNVFAKDYIETVNPGEKVAIEGDVEVLVDNKLANNFDSDPATGTITYIAIPSDGEKVTAYLIYGGKVHRMPSNISEEEARKLIDNYLNGMKTTYGKNVQEYDIK